ncbi:MAG: acetamidase/formamidase family protein [Thermomicrobiales bacterium]
MTIHDFSPDLYYSTMGSHSPVLRIADGDTVATTTVDARGFDASNGRATAGGNPMTGPFFVEGAAPGDTLEVRLDRIRPNRRHGWSGSVVAPNVVDPDFVPRLPEGDGSEWDVDVENGTATLVKPETALGRISLPLDPMIGCFGVAPDKGQAISTATSGPHGGNMDYRGHVEGVTALFPVFVEGGLFFIGDGHALQGDGEIVGSGIEISMDVEFTVHVRKGRHSHWPRVETGEELITLGNARPLDQALQHATTELMHWLDAEYGLNYTASSTLLAQVIRYEIGNVFDPAYTVAAKIARKWLP